MLIILVEVLNIIHGYSPKTSGFITVLFRAWHRSALHIEIALGKVAIRCFERAFDFLAIDSDTAIIDAVG